MISAIIKRCAIEYIVKAKIRLGSGSGQANIIATMLSFAMGVAILGSIIFVFGSMQSDILESIRAPQSREVLNYVAAASSALVNINATSSYVIITLPRRVGDLEYMISGSDYGDKIMLISPEISVNVSSPAPFSGEFESNYGNLMLRYEGGSITIRGVSD